MVYQDEIDKCLTDLKSTCKANYVFGGPVTEKKGRDKCILDLKNAGKFGKDRSSVCRNDPEECKHTGCAEVSERGNLAELMAEAAPEMGTTMGQMKGQMKEMMGKGGRIKKRKTKKARKTRKARRRKSLRPIKINPKMKGNFTKKAKKANMSVQQYARYVIKKYKGKTKTKKQVKLLREAVFARNAKTKFKH